MPGAATRFTTLQQMQDVDVSAGSGTYFYDQATGRSSTVLPAAARAAMGAVRKLLNTYDVTDYGAQVDGKQYGDGAMTASSAVFTSTLASFTSADVGKIMVVSGAGAAGVDLVTTISAYGSAHSVTLAATAGTTITGALFCYGTDDTAAWRAAIDAATTFCFAAVGTRSAKIVSPFGISMIGGSPQNASAANAILDITNQAKASALPGISLEIEGGGPPDTGYWELAAEPPHMTSTILFFTHLGSGTNPSGIGSLGHVDIGTSLDSSGNQTGTVFLRLNNIAFRKLPRSTINAVNWHQGGDFDIGIVLCDVFGRLATIPAGTAGAGICFPAINSSAVYYAHRVRVFGYYYGVSISNQGRITDLYTEHCMRGMRVHGGVNAYITTIWYWLTQNCPISIDVYDEGSANTCCILVNNMMREFWSSNTNYNPVVTPASEVNDPTNMLFGRITWSTTTSSRPLLSRNGGTKLETYNPFAGGIVAAPNFGFPIETFAVFINSTSGISGGAALVVNDRGTSAQAKIFLQIAGDNKALFQTDGDGGGSYKTYMWNYIVGNYAWLSNASGHFEIACPSTAPSSMLAGNNHFTVHCTGTALVFTVKTSAGATKTASIAIA